VICYSIFEKKISEKNFQEKIWQKKFATAARKNLLSPNLVQRNFALGTRTLEIFAKPVSWNIDNEGVAATLKLFYCTFTIV
jgi:hypothetical protein